jgi:hypothetical protein
MPLRRPLKVVPFILLFSLLNGCAKDKTRERESARFIIESVLEAMQLIPLPFTEVGENRYSTAGIQDSMRGEAFPMVFTVDGFKSAESKEYPVPDLTTEYVFVGKTNNLSCILSIHESAPPKVLRTLRLSVEQQRGLEQIDLGRSRMVGMVAACDAANATR